MAASPLADMAVSWFYLGGSLPGLLLLTEDNNATLHDYLAELHKLVKEYSAFAQQDQGKQQRLAAAAATAAAHQQQQQQYTARAVDGLSSIETSNGNISTTNSSTSNGSSTHKKLSRFFKSRSSKENNSISWISSSSSADSDSTISMVSSHNGLMISSTNSGSSQSGGPNGSVINGSAPSSSMTGSSGNAGSTNNDSMGEFSLLAVMNLPFVPDVHETFVSLCDIWIAAYRHMLEFSQGTQTSADLEALLSLDDWVKTELISPVIQKVDMLSKTLVYEESNKLDSFLIHAK